MALRTLGLRLNRPTILRTGPRTIGFSRQPTSPFWIARIRQAQAVNHGAYVDTSYVQLRCLLLEKLLSPNKGLHYQRMPPEIGINHVPSLAPKPRVARTSKYNAEDLKTAGLKFAPPPNWNAPELLLLSNTV